eukprot:264935_1
MSRLLQTNSETQINREGDHSTQYEHPFSIQLTHSITTRNGSNSTLSDDNLHTILEESHCVDNIGDLVNLSECQILQRLTCMALIVSKRNPCEIYMCDAFHLRTKKRLSEYAAVEQSIARVLSTESKYDATHALALGKMYGIESAVIYLYELLHLYHEIISHYRDKKEHEKIIETCSRFSSQDASLWITAFAYFVCEGNAQEEIRLCLQQISKLNLILPLMVTELLTNSDVHLSVIRD